MRKILVTGALGQIGSELTTALIEHYGENRVLATDIREPGKDCDCQWALLDVTDSRRVADIVRDHKIGTIYHLAALLSAVAEKKPQQAWQVNISGLYNVLEVAREFGCAVFTPSSIGAFGPNTPPVTTPQDTIQRPTTMYGVTKVAGELLCDYYFNRYKVDTRGLRYPGIVSHKTPPGGGTTDYAVDIYYQAVREKRYTCFLKDGTYLDMMYMPDAISGAIQLMEADPTRLIHRNAFNVTAMSVAPEMLAASIRKHIPQFEIIYDVDPARQAIADSWPDSIDDSAAREEWDWQPEYDLERMTIDMLNHLREKLMA